jgi:hypothetical protein
MTRYIKKVSDLFGSKLYRSFGWQRAEESGCVENATQFIALLLDGMPFIFGDSATEINWFPYDKHDPKGEKYSKDCV